MFRTSAHVVTATFAMVAIGSSAFSQDQKLQVRKLDPNSTVAETMKDKGGVCHIVIVKGVWYEVCPYLAPLSPEVEKAIKELETR